MRHMPMKFKSFCWWNKPAHILQTFFYSEVASNCCITVSFRYNGDAVHWNSSISLFNSKKSTRSQTWIWEFGGIWDHKLAYWGPILLSFYALNPEVTGAQIAEPRANSVQVSDAAVAILVASRPELQMFANARMCFIPYWVNGPQLLSKVRTCHLSKNPSRWKFQTKSNKTSISQKDHSVLFITSAWMLDIKNLYTCTSTCRHYNRNGWHIWGSCTLCWLWEIR